ncbi:hypothetical protein B0H12DRAFT_1122765 [Mycena haematopus]|nr:hypothetical protein B0H12DRAFT_1122765 [Mycena haematopus]
MTTTMPLTTHALPQTQRLRLMRSTRKLGELLGETPLLVETSPTSTSSPFSRRSRSASRVSTEPKRSGRLYMASATTPQTSSLTLGVTRDVASAGDSSLARPMLLLHLPAAHLSATEHADLTSLPSPLSPTFSLTLNSPMTPTFPLDTRRRKMAKLMRTLGENVPPELVFPTSIPKARRRASTVSVRESILERDLAHKNSATSFNVVRIEDPFSDPPFTTEGRSSSDTYSSTSTHDSTSSLEQLLPSSHAHRNMHRKEQGWSGEWAGGVSNMDDVVRRLRGLKT